MHDAAEQCRARGELKTADELEDRAERLLRSIEDTTAFPSISWPTSQGQATLAAPGPEAIACWLLDIPHAAARDRRLRFAPPVDRKIERTLRRLRLLGHAERRVSDAQAAGRRDRRAERSVEEQR
jgi:hypothetical protein